MPFSFNPNQTEPAAGTSTGWQAAPEVAGTQATSPAGDSKSPILFLQESSGAKSVQAYLQLLLIFVNILFILGALSLLGYGFYLQSSIESSKTDLATKESGFKTYPIDEMRDLSNRVAKLSQLLTEYVSIRSPLRFLEDVVENNVVFNDFGLKKGDSGYVANFVAITNDYPTLIQQLAALKLTQYSKVAPSPKLGNLTAEKDKLLKVSITSPVFVQGLLPGEVVFLPPQTATTTPKASSSSPTTVGTSTDGSPSVVSSFQ